MLLVVALMKYKVEIAIGNRRGHRAPRFERKGGGEEQGNIMYVRPPVAGQGRNGKKSLQSPP